MRMEPSWLHHLPRPHLFILLHRGLSFNRNFGAVTIIKTTATIPSVCPATHHTSVHVWPRAGVKHTAEVLEWKPVSAFATADPAPHCSPPLPPTPQFHYRTGKLFGPVASLMVILSSWPVLSHWGWEEVVFWHVSLTLCFRNKGFEISLPGKPGFLIQICLPVPQWTSSSWANTFALRKDKVFLSHRSHLPR